MASSSTRAPCSRATIAFCIRLACCVNVRPSNGLLVVVLLRLVHEDDDCLATHVHTLVVVVFQRRRRDAVACEDERQRCLGCRGRRRSRSPPTGEDTSARAEGGRALLAGNRQLVALPYLEARDDLERLEPGSVHAWLQPGGAELIGDVLRRTLQPGVPLPRPARASDARNLTCSMYRDSLMASGPDDCACGLVR